MCQEFSQCYDDVDICLWTDGSRLTHFEAEAACQQRNGSFLARITDSHVQYKLQLFRSAHNATRDLLATDGFWIGINATNVNNFQWIDGSSLSG